MSYSFRQTGECVKEKTRISISDCLIFRLNEIHESEIISAGLSQLPIPSPGQAPPPMFLFLLFWKHQCPRNSGSPPRPAAASDLDIPSFLQGHGTCCILGFLLYKMGRASNFVFSTVPMTPSASFWLMGTFFFTNSGFDFQPVVKVWWAWIQCNSKVTAPVFLLHDWSNRLWNNSSVLIF